MTPAMDPCPFAPKKARGAHCLSVIIPATSKHPATLFCDKCGMSRQMRMDYVRPADDLVADAIRTLTLPR